MYRTIETLQSWVEEFVAQQGVGAGAIRVIPQDGDDGADTGLVAMRLLNSPTEIYLEPPHGSVDEWTITFEPREEPVTLGSSAVSAMATEIARLAALCAYLQQRSDAYPDRPA